MNRFLPALRVALSVYAPTHLVVNQRLSSAFLLSLMMPHSPFLDVLEQECRKWAGQRLTGTKLWHPFQNRNICRHLVVMLKAACEEFHPCTTYFEVSSNYLSLSDFKTFLQCVQEVLFLLKTCNFWPQSDDHWALLTHNVRLTKNKKRAINPYIVLFCAKPTCKLMVDCLHIYRIASLMLSSFFPPKIWSNSAFRIFMCF